MPQGSSCKQLAAQKGRLASSDSVGREGRPLQRELSAARNLPQDLTGTDIVPITVSMWRESFDRTIAIGLSAGPRNRFTRDGCAAARATLGSRRRWRLIDYLPLAAGFSKLPGRMRIEADRMSFARGQHSIEDRSRQPTGKTMICSPAPSLVEDAFTSPVRIRQRSS